MGGRLLRLLRGGPWALGRWARRNGDGMTGGVVVEIEGVMAPTEFKKLGDAVAAVWESLRPLPLGWTQYEAYRYFFDTPGAEERVTEFLERDRCLTLTFAIAGRSHYVRVEVAR
ncbi:hypothetical protein GCM10009760_14360 [Kitasatospora kazusensis]|uniref:Uncharacterized protein n=1 Tax=Kitasatospora kazusensis TaxID=407974 RepID=A0ABP5KPX7_9ACTN